MNSFLEFNGSLYYHRLDVRIAATKKTCFDSWPGAFIRNNILASAEKIITTSGVSLRSLVNNCPLSADHPLYRELSGGFPKAYHIALPAYDLNRIPQTLNKGDLLSFSLYLTGHFSVHYPAFLDAIRLMCSSGIGHPKTSFLLVDVMERASDGELHLMAMGDTNTANKLLFPVYLHNWNDVRTNNNEKTITIQYLTPVNLFRRTEKKDKALSYQDKCNGFPSFYQLVRSAAYRIAKLTALYAEPDKPEACREMLDNVEEFIDFATNVHLSAIDMKYMELPNTPKKETENKMPLAGYVGTQVYEGCFNKYLPLLKFMEELGVGNEVVYGMGRYKVEVGG